jgi:ribosome-binding protein aMBF1 (putative translation factor)
MNQSVHISDIFCSKYINISNAYPEHIDNHYTENYNKFMTSNKMGLGEVIRQQRVSIPLTLQELARMGKVSPSHLGRIERGERYPSARILRKIAKPLGFEEDELFTLAGYLSSPQASMVAETNTSYNNG